MKNIYSKDLNFNSDRLKVHDSLYENEPVLARLVLSCHHMTLLASLLTKGLKDDYQSGKHYILVLRI